MVQFPRYILKCQLKAITVSHNKQVTFLSCYTNSGAAAGVFVQRTQGQSRQLVHTQNQLGLFYGNADFFNIPGNGLSYGVKPPVDPLSFQAGYMFICATARGHDK